MGDKDRSAGAEFAHFERQDADSFNNDGEMQALRAFGCRSFC